MRFSSIAYMSLTLLMVLPSGMQAASVSDDVLNDSLPSRWVYDEHFNQSVPTDDLWWTYFDDPLLDSLITEGVENNYNVLMAARRIDMARQSLNSARAAYFPTLAFSGGWTKSRSSGMLAGNEGHAATVDYFSLGLNMSWEIDVFGKITSRAKERKASFNATRAEYVAVMTALCGNIAKAYVNLRVYQAELAVANEHIASQEKIVKITEARHEAGLASMLDVAQAKVVYYSTQASVPGLQSAIHRTVNGLATLIGVYPEEVYSRLETVAPMPDYNQIVPVGIPAQLLRRRPDIVQAEYELAGYAAALGIAKKEFLPTLTINGSIGTSAHDAGSLFKSESLTYAVAPTLSWTIFDGMARKYNVVSARRQMEIGIDNYNLTVMTAVQEVDDAISTYVSTLKNIDVLREVVTQSEQSLNLSLDLYKRGLNPFNDVVTAQLNVLENQNSLIVSKGNALVALIALYEALGGGWDVSRLEE